MSVTPFQQQGSIDWTSLSKSSLEFTIDVLSRLSQAGIEGLTVAVAYKMFTTLTLGERGEQRVQLAISKLKAFSSFNNVLTLGFGVKHIVRVMADTADGLSCAAMCAALREVYDPVHSAKVLRHMYKLLQPPLERQPSLRQWMNLLDACAGALASSTFGHTCSQMMSFYRTPGQSCYRAAAAEPEAIARALVALGDLSSGRVESITIVGGPDCGWLAAVAEFLLDLPVEIIDGREDDKKIYHRSGGKATRPVGGLTVIYKLSESETATAEAGALTVTRRTYAVPSGQKLVRYTDVGTHNVLSYGRVSWDHILEDTFGPAAELLLKPNQNKGLDLAVGKVLGQLARILEIYAAGDWPAQLSTQFQKPRYPPHIGSYGKNFIATVKSWFPEIASSRCICEAMQDVYLSFKAPSIEKMVGQYIESWCALAAFCPCNRCQSCPRDPQPERSDGDRAQRMKNVKQAMEDSQLIGESFCLLIVIEAIAKLAQTLFHVNFCVDSPGTSGKILPLRSGVETIYSILAEDQYSEFPSRHRFDITLRTIPSDIIGETAVIFGGVHFELWARGRLNNQVKSRPRGDVAFTHGGLCFALNILFEPTDDLDKVGIIQIAPGQIEWQGLSYNRVQDLPNDPHGGAASRYMSGPSEPLNSTIVEIKPADKNAISALNAGIQSPSITCRLEVTEEDPTGETSTMVLHANYRLSWSTGSIVVGPRYITEKLLESSVGRRCHTSNCASSSSSSVTLPLPMPGSSQAVGIIYRCFVVGGDKLPGSRVKVPYPSPMTDQNNYACDVYFHPSQSDFLSRWVILCRSKDYDWTVYQNRSCITCLCQMIHRRNWRIQHSPQLRDIYTKKGGISGNAQPNEPIESSVAILLRF